MTQKRLINITCYKYIPKIKKANGNSEQVYIEDNMRDLVNEEVMYNIVMIDTWIFNLSHLQSN